MSSITLDKNALNGLFDNQKKLDDLFDSIFDDGNCFISNATSVQTESHYSAYRANHYAPSNHSRMTDSLLVIKEQHPYFFMLPIVLEIAAIYCVVVNFL
jgi:hypothetical protein